MAYSNSNTRNFEQQLLRIVTEVFNNKKNGIEEYLRQINSSVTLSMNKAVLYKDIKDALDFNGIPSSFIGVLTDKGLNKTSTTDGGVISVNVNGISLPLAWFECKLQNCSSSYHHTRGQASGLISEPALRCRVWASALDNKVKPFVAFMKGDDFNPDNGIYNINRIQIDLQTEGNVSPYENDNGIGVSWFFFKEDFSDDEMRGLIEMVIDTNVSKIKEVLENKFNEHTVQEEAYANR